MRWILPLSLLIAFEFIADILAKQWSLKQKTILAVGSLLGYLIANSFWLFALKNGSGLARGAVIFSVASAIIAIALGIFLFKENVNKFQIIGLALGVVSIILLFWND
jgi:multidrug transporter EmrE-like cation transporter